MVFDETKALEFERVKERLADFAMSYLGKDHIERMEPMTDLSVLEGLLDEAEEASEVIRHGVSVPIPSLEGIRGVITGIGKGLLLSAEDLSLVGRLLESTSQLKRFMARKESVAPRVASYAYSLYELKELDSEIQRCIRHGQITDGASSELGRVRKRITILEERLKKKLNEALTRHRSLLQESVISMRGNRYVLAVKKEHRKRVSGIVLDESASGQTVFIEPADIASLTYELGDHRAEEAREEMKILGMLTELAEAHLLELKINLETIGHYDFVFAKAKYARSIDGRRVSLNRNGVIRIRSGRHPLLGSGMVPLHFAIGEGYRSLIITGPNTGGKTVALKTVGLLTLMAQCGLLVPVDEGSRLAVFTGILADIGDGQSLENSLSTFSAHIKNVIRILDKAGDSTLILLDELASGTDPGEGIGLSIAVLEELHRRKSTVIATTHFNEIKSFAEQEPGFRNARMEFDRETLQPLYRLTIGVSGSSYAFEIARKLGISQAIIERSRAITYGGSRNEEMEGEQKQSQQRDQIPREDQVPSQEPPNRQADIKPNQEEALVPSEAPGGEPNPNQRTGKAKGKDNPQQTYEIGDCVWIRSLKRTGIICSLPDNRGDIKVMIQKEKVKINRKRLSLYISRKELYPEGEYDMDIVFESKEVRKKKKVMGKRHDPDNIIIRPSED